MDYTQFETPLSKTLEVVGFRISNNIIVTLFSEVRISIILTYRYGETQWDTQKEIKISGEDYTKWGNDDNYIINLVKSRINELI